MIAHLEGVLRELSPTRVVLDVNGVGYEVHVPLSTFGALPDTGKTVALHITTCAREGAPIQLFGFATRAERTAFEMLLRASRVGPKLAQTVLSGVGLAELLDAIRGGKVAVLRGVPGIGAKTAERLLVELRDRADELEAELLAAGGAPAAQAAAGGELDRVREQVLSALVNLGYGRNQAERVLAGAMEREGPDGDLETLVRACLRDLSR